MANNKMTAKQQRFCEEYIIDWNATRACIAAGYSEKTASETGYENLRKPQLQRYIEEIQKDLQKTAHISRLSVLNDFLSIKNDAEKDADKIKALENIAKMLGFNEPEKIQAEIKQAEFDPSKLTEEEMSAYLLLARKHRYGGGE